MSVNKTKYQTMLKTILSLYHLILLTKVILIIFSAQNFLKLWVNDMNNCTVSPELTVNVSIIICKVSNNIPVL